MKRSFLLLLGSLSLLISFATPHRFDLTFTNMAAINSTAEVANTTINVLGFYSPGDGGGGTFYWNATSTLTPVPGMVIKIGSTDPGRLLRIYSPGLVNILWLGAHGDGINDDAPAFKTAAAMTNTVINVPNPANFYRISSKIVMSHSGITIRGADKVNTRIVGDINVPSIFQIIYNVYNVNFQNVSIENTDTAKLSAKPNCIIIQMDTVLSGTPVTGRVDSNFAIRNCSFTGKAGYTNGIILFVHRSGYGGLLRNVTIDQCDFDSLGSSGIGALGEYNAPWYVNVSMTNNKFIHCGVQPDTTGFGITMSGLGTNILADHNYLYDCKVIGIEFNGPSYSTISNNVFEKLSSAGTCPYTINNGPTPQYGATPTGVNNAAINNVVVDSTNTFSYIVNQTGLRSSGNVQKSFGTTTAYLRIEDVQGAFTGDKYTNVGNSPLMYLRGKTSSTFTQCTLVGTSGGQSLITTLDSANNNTFQNCVFSTTGFLITTSSLSPTNRFLNCYYNIPNSNFYDAGLPPVTNNSYKAIVLGNDSIRREVSLSSMSTALGAGPDSVQTITSGTTATVTNGTNVVRFNLTSLASSFTLTLPAQWHSSRGLIVAFTPNGSIAAGSPMITNLTIVAGSGQTLSQSANPVSAIAGNTLSYRLIAGNIDQRTN